MKTVTLSVNDQMANRLSSLSQDEIDKLMKMVQAALDDKRTLEEIMKEAQEQAARNGLTEEKLNQILGDLD